VTEDPGTISRSISVFNTVEISHAKDIDALLSRNDAEAHALSLRGTPGVVIGRQLLPGIVDLNGLKQLVANSRHEQ
jgi:protein-disulfide isomerase